jgi:SAM-dependent methyltransferase
VVQARGRRPNYLVNIKDDYLELYCVELRPENAAVSVRTDWLGRIDGYPPDDAEIMLVDSHSFANFILSYYIPYEPWEEMYLNCISPLLEKYEVSTMLDINSGVGITAAACNRDGVRAYMHEPRGRLNWFAKYHSINNKTSVADYEGQIVDAVITTGGLNTTRNPAKLIKQIDSALKEGGLLIVNTLPYVLLDPFNPSDTVPDWRAMLLQAGYTDIGDNTFIKGEVR